MFPKSKSPEELKQEEAISRAHKIIYTDENHLNELIKEIVSLHQEDGYENFEEISMFIKKKMTQLSTEYVPIPYIHNSKITYTPKENKILREKTKIKIDKTLTINNYMEDIFLNSNMLEWAGISFNPTEWYKIRIAMKKILVENDCEYIRFFGKIFAKDTDYYIIQGLPRKYPAQNPPKHVETRGSEGINKYTFWVSDSVLEYWKELPDITHEQLVKSRNFKYIFTGHLTSPVNSFIYFPGKEMHLLKCQIVRILHSSSICPKGYQKLSENFKEQLEGKVTEIDEEYKPATFEEMKAPEFDNWTHEQPYIYPNGKCIDPEIEGQVDRMRGINEDEGYKIKEGGENEGEEPTEVDMKFWKIKVIGDQMSYNVPDKEPVTHAVVHITNERWQGTHTVWKEGNFCNIYIGFGYKNTDQCFNPTQLDKVDKDPRDITEHPEPNPEKEPVIPEADSDDEKKEGEKEE